MKTVGQKLNKADKLAYSFHNTSISVGLPTGAINEI
jgi:hypothetical protein